MKSLKFVLVLFAAAAGFQSHALDINDLQGSWKEIGYRCVGDKEFKPRPFTARKFFTITDFNYIHRVEMDDVANCPFVDSSGSMQTSYSPGSRWLELLIQQPDKSTSCTVGQVTVVDDFMLSDSERHMWVTLGDINGETYLIIGGNPTYIDSSCASTPVIERVYAKH